MANHIIIGGSKGIGRALAKSLVGQAHTVTVVSRSRPAGLEGSNFHHLEGDLEKPGEVVEKIQESLTRHGPVNGLVFLQRYRGKGDDWQGELQVSLTASKKIIEGLADRFAPAPNASIVLVGSNAGHFISKGGPLSYHVAKTGISTLVRWFAMNLGAKGIRVNGVSPCTILKEESKDFYLNNEKLHGLYKQILPLGRMGNAEEVANAIELFLSPKASFITGQEVYVDGGLSLHLHDNLARMVSGL